jgi:hypothetical protein
MTHTSRADNTFSLPTAVPCLEFAAVVAMLDSGSFYSTTLVATLRERTRWPVISLLT